MPSGKVVRDFYLWGVLAFVTIVGIVAMPSTIYPADPQAVQWEVIHFINTGQFGVERTIVKDFEGERGQYYDENTARGLWFSKYGILNDVMILPPLYVEAVWRGAPLSYRVHLPYEQFRLVTFDLYNILLSLGVAYYLYRIACCYTPLRWIAVVFVLSSLYCTYWWFYLRAQNFEIYQTLFMLGFYYRFTEFFRTTDEDPKAARNQLFPAGLFLGALILVKSLFVIVIPICAFLLAYAAHCRPGEKAGKSWQAEVLALARPVLWLAGPVAVACILLLLGNWYKFGSPLETGYSQWGEHHQPIFSGNMLKALGYLFFGIQGNIFIHFPVLLFALFGMRAFLRRWPLDSLLILIVSVCIFAIVAKFHNWIGWWCYGPRYVLSVLPLLSLPFIVVIEYLRDHFSHWSSRACAAMIVACLAYSCWLQVYANSLPPFAYFYMRDSLEKLNIPEVNDYLDYHPFGIIYHDMESYQAGGPWVVATMLDADRNEESRETLHAYVEQFTFSDYFWWPSPLVAPIPTPEPVHDPLQQD
jgi:hypothetical protein